VQRLTPETFFQGRLAGWGVARDLFGRILRRFTIEMVGEWSEEHRALHLDETYAYIDGETHQRRWAIHTDDQGYILGHDALEVARMRGRQIGVDFEIVFDRPRQPGRFNSVTQIVRFVEVTPDQSLMLGRVLRFGLTVATIDVGLKRIS
jgi:hypothetical protein